MTDSRELRLSHPQLGPLSTLGGTVERLGEERSLQIVRVLNLGSTSYQLFYPEQVTSLSQSLSLPFVKRGWRIITPCHWVSSHSTWFVASGSASSVVCGVVGLPLWHFLALSPNTPMRLSTARPPGLGKWAPGFSFANGHPRIPWTWKQRNLKKKTWILLSFRIWYSDRHSKTYHQKHPRLWQTPSRPLDLPIFCPMSLKQKTIVSGCCVSLGLFHYRLCRWMLLWRTGRIWIVKSI